MLRPARLPAVVTAVSLSLGLARQAVAATLAPVADILPSPFFGGVADRPAISRPVDRAEGPLAGLRVVIGRGARARLLSGTVAAVVLGHLARDRRAGAVAGVPSVLVVAAERDGGLLSIRLFAAPGHGPRAIVAALP